MKIFILILLLIIPSTAYAESVTPHYPGAVHQIILHSEQREKQSKLAHRIGLNLDTKYSYAEYSDIKRENDLGTAGNYDFLLLSTGGNEWDNDSYNKFISKQCGWETMYYSNHDLTVIHEICRDQTGERSWVRILKVGQGRLPNLYLE